MDTNTMIRYSMELAMLARLKKNRLITEEEYKKMLVKIRKDYGVASDKST